MMQKTDGRTTDTKQRILREAKRMYLKGGYNGISLQELATCLEISKPALFHHYKSKQELFYEVLLDISRNNRAVIREAIEQSQDARSRLRNILLAMRQQPFFDPMKFLNEEIGELSEAQQQEIRRYFYEGLQGPIRQILEEAVRSGELRPHDTRLSQMVFSTLMMLLPSPGNPIVPYLGQSTSVEKYVDELLSFFIDGLRSTSN